MRIVRQQNDLDFLLAQKKTEHDLSFSSAGVFHRLTRTIHEGLKFYSAVQEKEQQQIAARGGPLFFMNPTLAENTIEINSTDIVAKLSKKMPGQAAAWYILPDLIEDAVTLLSQSKEIRRSARAVPGFIKQVKLAVGSFKSCQLLSEILLLPEDETILVVDPIQKIGMRVMANGLSNLGELHMFLSEIWPTPGPKPHLTVLSAYRKLTLTGLDNPPIAKARFQFFKPTTISVLNGFDGSEDWLWNDQRLSRLPFVNFERTVFVGPLTMPQSWEAIRTLPFPAESLKVVEIWQMDQVNKWLETHAPQLQHTSYSSIKAA